MGRKELKSVTPTTSRIGQAYTVVYSRVPAKKTEAIEAPELVIVDVVKTASMGCDARRARRRYNQRPHFVH